MKVLGIETSSTTASVAIGDENKIIGVYSTNYKKTHSQTIMPMIEELINNINMDINEVDIIGISAGPGSFTGLRIGSATAKGLAHVLDVPIVSVNTLEALAYNIPWTDKLICPMMDARRQRVFASAYLYDGQELKEVIEVTGEEVTLFIQKVLKFNKDIIFLGDGFQINEEILVPLLKDRKYIEAPIHLRYNTAASVVTLANKYVKEDKVETYLEHKPIYLKESQAEREYAARQKNDSPS